MKIKILYILYKWVLYKRAESSIYAFYTSVKKLHDRINTYIHFLKKINIPNNLKYIIDKDLEERHEVAI